MNIKGIVGVFSILLFSVAFGLSIFWVIARFMLRFDRDWVGEDILDETIVAIGLLIFLGVFLFKWSIE